MELWNYRGFPNLWLLNMEPCHLGKKRQASINTHWANLFSRVV